MFLLSSLLVNFCSACLVSFLNVVWPELLSSGHILALVFCVI